MWNVWDVGCSRSEIIKMLDVPEVRYSRCGMLGIWDIRDVGYYQCIIYMMRDVQDLGCSRLGMFGMRGF